MNMTFRCRHGYRRKFWAPDNGGYVYEITQGRDVQICTRLARTGETLRVDPASDLRVYLAPHVAAARRDAREFGVCWIGDGDHYPDGDPTVENA